MNEWINAKMIAFGKMELVKVKELLFLMRLIYDTSLFLKLLYIWLG